MSEIAGIVVPCQYNKEGVVCKLPRQCLCCGWNPRVAEYRKLKFLYGDKIQGGKKS